MIIRTEIKRTFLFILFVCCWGCAGSSGTGSERMYILSADADFISHMVSDIAFGYMEMFTQYSVKDKELYWKKGIRTIRSTSSPDKDSSVRIWSLTFDSFGCWTGDESIEVKIHNGIINSSARKIRKAVYVKNAHDNKIREFYQVIAVNEQAVDTLIWGRCFYNDKGQLSAMEMQRRSFVGDEIDDSEVDFQYDENEQLIGYRVYAYQALGCGVKEKYSVVYYHKLNAYYRTDTVLRARRLWWGLVTGAAHPKQISHYDSVGRLLCNVTQYELLPDTYVYQYKKDSVYMCKDRVACSESYPDSLASTIIQLNERGLPIREEYRGYREPLYFRYEYEYW